MANSTRSRDPSLVVDLYRYIWTISARKQVILSSLAAGGWLLQGKTEMGTIVAFISGLARMNGPWGDLVNCFRDLTNTGLKYRMIAAELDPVLADVA